MKAEKPISVPKNIKFTEDNSNNSYKQEQNFKKFIKHNLIQKLFELDKKFNI